MRIGLDQLADLRTKGTPRGITSVCSAHPVVLRAALRHGVATGVTVLIEWISRDRQHGLQLDGKATKPIRYALYYTLIAIIIVCAPLGGGEFIYFQF